MRKEIIDLMNRLRIAEQKLNAWKFDFKTVLERIKLLREKWEVEKLLNLYTPEEIFTAVNYEKLKRQMRRRQVRKALMIENAEREDEEEERLREQRYQDESIEFLLYDFYCLHFYEFQKFSAIGQNFTNLTKQRKNKNAQ